MLKIIILLLFTGFNAYSQNIRYQRIDAYATNTPESETTSLKTLAQYLILPTINDSEEVRSIYTWITTHIKYDWAAYKNKTCGYKSPDEILVERKGVCQNFADLFTVLCQQVGLQAYTVSGYAKSNIDYTWLVNGFGSDNHVWNVVKVYGKWRLIDATWGEGTNNENYFMGNPYIFLQDHLPIDAKWQLIADTLSLKQFESTPYITHVYNDDSISNLKPATGFITGKKHIVFEFDSPVDFNPGIEVKNFSALDKIGPVHTEKFTQNTTHEGNHYKLDLQLTDDKLYRVTLYDSSSYSSIAVYAVNIRPSTNYNSNKIVLK